MPSNPTADSEPLPTSRIIPGPTHLRQYPAHDLVAWQPQGVLDDQLLDEIGEWLCHIEKASAPFKRFVDFSRLTNVAVRIKHVFAFAQKRAEQFAGITPVKSALFSEDWVGFGIARLYENLMKGTPIDLAAASSRWSLAEMDEVLGLKGWNYAFPSFAESVTLDYGGWRSSLASVGIGLIEYNVTRFQANILDTPREGPRFNPFYDSAQSYWGQKPSFHDISALALIYDLSRFGVPDGQLQLAGNFNYATYQGFNPNTASFAAAHT